MQLPKDIISQTYKKPDLYLCETDKSKICKLETIDTQASLKLNSYSELSFTVGRTYEDIIAGEQKVNPFYNKIEALRLIYLDGFGYFEIQDPELNSNGIQETKTITAYSLEYNLSQKYLEDFYINTGENNSVEIIYAEDNNKYDSNGNLLVVPVTLYNPQCPELSLLHLILEKVYGWSIGHVDSSLQTMSRTFEISRESVYDFMINDICDKFNCFFTFDTIENKINIYAESLISKFIGDGVTTSFTLVTPYESIDTVSIDSYKTTAYVYDPSSGVLTFDEAPANEARIEVTDGSQSQWKTDVYVSFNNLAQEVNVTYSAEDIKTVLTVKGSDDLDIREVNFGLPYITDLSYYYTVDWMGQDLYNAYTAYLQKCNSYQIQYKENSQKMLEVSDKISYEENRLSLQYSIAKVNSNTVGTYYIRGGTSPNYYYTEVTLPEDYNANIEHYYTLSGNDLTEEKFSKFYESLKTYFSSGDSKDTSDIEALKDDFAFMETYTIDNLISDLTSAVGLEEKDTAIITFLDQLWDQLGLTPLKKLYKEPYETIQSSNIEAGWNDESSEYYWLYYPVTLVVKSINDEISERQITIDNYQKEYDELSSANSNISQELLLVNNFNQQQLIRLSAFLREDEYTDDSFIETSSDTIESLLQTKQELLECGRIELSKLCEPKLEFSMSMANIYALEEFAPIVHQFQLGNLINVVIRDDYIKRSRLLQVDINFDDLSDFSCEFSELTNLKTPSSIHADLLANAVQAGKSVASNASYWNKGADLATKTALKIESGLLDATNGLYSSNQGVIIDKNGIKLTKIIDPETGEVSPYQAWIVNNNILFSTDGFKTSETGLGEFTIDGETMYGLLAQAVLSGYIESSRIVGGTINIGNGTFMVDEFGNVTMGGNSKIGDMTIQDIQDSILDESEVVYTSCPVHGDYLADEIWVVGERDYIQTDENGNIIDSSGNIITPVSIGTVSDDKTSVLDSNGNIIGTIQNSLVIDDSDTVVGVYDDGRNIASSIVGYIQDGSAVDSSGTSIGDINRNVVTNEETLVGLVSGDYVISAETIGTATVSLVEAGSVLRSVNDGNGVYKSTDWVSALGKYDQQDTNLNNRVCSIEGNLDQHFEFSNDNGLIIKDGNSTIYTRLLNDRWSFMQQDTDPLVGDAEVAYISDKKLYISSAEITGLDGEDGNLDVNGPATVKELRVDNTDTSNSLVIKAEDNGSFSILIETQGS